MNLTCLYYVARGYKAIYHLKSLWPYSFDAAGCLKSDNYKGSTSASTRIFGFNENDRTSKFSLIDFETVKRK